MTANKFNDDLTGKVSTGAKYYTGLAPNKVLAINPTVEKLKEIIGENATKFDTSYPLRKSPLFKDGPLKDLDVRTISIWITDKDEKVSPTILSIDLAQATQVSAGGNKRIINNKLQSTWGESVEAVKNNPNMSWFSHDGIREARIGEVDYYEFLATYLRFDLKSDVSFLTYCETKGISFDHAYKGDYNSLTELVNWGNTDEGEKEPWYITQLWVVKETDKGLRQEILSNPDTWFRCSQDRVGTYEINLLKKRESKAKESGRNLTTRLYTHEFKEFSKEGSINGAPEFVANPSSNVEDLDWLD